MRYFATIPVFYCGFSLWWAWIFLAIFSSNVEGSPIGDFGGTQVVWIVSMLSTSMSFIVLYVLGKSGHMDSRTHVKRWIVAGSISLATGILAYASSIFGQPLWAAASGAALGGAGLAYFALPWGVRFTELEAKQSQIALVASFLLAVVIYLILSKMPYLARMITTAMLPLLMAFCLGRLSRVPGRTDVRVKPNWLKGDRTLFLRLSVVAAISSFIFCGFRELLPFQSATEASVSSEIVFALSGLLSVVLMVMCLVLKKGIGLSLLYKVALPLVVLGALFFSVFDQGDSTLAIAAIMTGMRCASLLFWITFVALASRNIGRVTFIFCFGFAASYLGGAIGAVVGVGLSQVIISGAINIITLSLIALLVMIVSVGWLVGVPSAAKLEQREADGFAEPASIREGQVIEIAAAQGLTKRETEILQILSQGRTLPYVAEKLFIAPTTVQTHVKHIYKKLGVHNRQELLDYLEQCN